MSEDISHAELAQRFDGAVTDLKDYIEVRLNRNEDKSDKRNDRIWSELRSQGGSLSEIRERTANMEGRLETKAAQDHQQPPVSAKFWAVMEKMAVPIGWSLFLLVLIAVLAAGINLADIPILGGGK